MGLNQIDIRRDIQENIIINLEQKYTKLHTFGDVVGKNELVNDSFGRNENVNEGYDNENVWCVVEQYPIENGY